MRWCLRLDARPRTMCVRRPVRSSSRPMISTRRPRTTIATSWIRTSALRAGITKAQSAARRADQHAQAAGQAADPANQSAQEAVNRVDTLTGVMANLDNYKELSDVSVTFGFDKSVLTADDKEQLDQFAANLTEREGLHSRGDGRHGFGRRCQYNYRLSHRRADAVVNYLATEVQHSAAQVLPDRHWQGQPVATTTAVTDARRTAAWKSS